MSRISVVDFTLFVMALGAVVGSLMRPASACPFCLGSQQLTLRERIETPDASVLVEWRSGEPGNLETGVADSTTFEVMKVWRGEFDADEPLSIDRYQQGRPGDRFLLIGTNLDGVVRWDRAIPLSEAALTYVHSLPPSEASTTSRLRHAFDHLESDDTTIANDAFGVIAAAKFEDIAAAAEHLDPARVRRWVHNPETHVTRLGVYGMLLGMVGSPDDLFGLGRKILHENQDQPIRIGIDGVMAGFLLLAGAEGLDELDRAYLLRSDASLDDLNAVTSALRFMWEYADGVIPKDRLRESMRLGLNHEPTRDLTIVDLARWRDWAATNRLVAIYEEEVGNAFLRRSIVRFLIVAVNADTVELRDDERRSVQQAGRKLESIREADPSLYRSAERGLVIPTTRR